MYKNKGTDHENPLKHHCLLEKNWTVASRLQKGSRTRSISSPVTPGLRGICGHTPRWVTMALLGAHMIGTIKINWGWIGRSLRSWWYVQIFRPKTCLTLFGFISVIRKSINNERDIWRQITLNNNSSQSPISWRLSPFWSWWTTYLAPGLTCPILLGLTVTTNKCSCGKITTNMNNP